MAQEVQNVMKEIRLDKIVLNMGLGKSGDAVEIAKKALGQISGRKVNERSAKKAHRDLGVRIGEPIGAAVSIRGNDGKELLKRLLEAKGNRVNGRSFDNMGNLSFGILEHTSAATFPSCVVKISWREFNSLVFLWKVS